MNHMFSPAIVCLRRARLGLSLVVALAAAPAPVHALQTTADCPPPQASLPMAKRSTSGCPKLGLPSFTRGTFRPTLLEPATGGFLARFYKLKDDLTGQRYAGVVRTDAQGRFQWSLAATNADLWISELQPHRFAIAQSEISPANPGVVFGPLQRRLGNSRPNL